MGSDLTHLNSKGEAHIVDIGNKPVTKRRALAGAKITAERATIAAIMGSHLQKGDALAVARIAGIMAAKKTSELIPLCHPLALTKVELKIVQDSDSCLSIQAVAETSGQTGVEMEALVAASTAALTIYDMAKALDRSMTITDICLLEKSGGKSGDYTRA